MVKIIRGQPLAEEIYTVVREQLSRLHRQVTLSIIKVGNDPASNTYTNTKARIAKELGIKVQLFNFEESTTQQEIANLIIKLNNDKTVDGILLQLPLPLGLSARELLDLIDPSKDIDGLNMINQGKLFVGSSDGICPCTPLGVMYMIGSVCHDIAGLQAVVLGRSQIVGNSVAQMLLRTHCTVNVLHSYSRDLPSLCKTADILVSAVGRPMFVKADWIKKGAIVIDVGINRISYNGTSKIVGDIEFEEASHVAQAITPVPGGVGLMTVAFLMHNTVSAALRHNSKV